ncbi:hypothetical protein SBA1_100066 [Candidatus Sulfotelmatobacter kueseliae]|uniref:Uncharacterized protein n=1 Tax=Candidatus Sulfotelmatobacter kueseliae TaxID=2042962 RepID=A0A2U3JWD8_9BACT|nr:hypothetical protein SBA1_100066 [Candidatus Sulfotelmatobacter kueseliae]
MKDHLRNLRGPMRERLEKQTSRREGVAKILRETPSATDLELAKVFEVNRDTIHRDRKYLMQQANQNAVSQFEIWRDEHIAELNKLRESLEDFLIPPERRIELALAIIREDVKVKGTAAPTRSENLNVNADVQVIPIEEQIEYANAFAGLYPDERYEELDRVKARKRTCRVVIEGGGPQKRLSE